MKILFQGGWKAGRDPEENKETISEYCETLAKYIVENNHQIVLTSNWRYDKTIADKIIEISNEQNKQIKDHLMYLLSEREKEIPSKGRVIKFEPTKWWIEERTYCIQQTDALIAIGGGKGTYDCVEKSFLSGKPVFVAAAISSPATSAWRRHKKSYKYINEGDADFIDDINNTPEEFFQEVFKIINTMAEKRYTRKVFIVHGRDYYFRDSLVNVLKELDFEPIVLHNEPNKGLTIIEKLERDTKKIGFCFLLYTPDDLGNLNGEEPKARARQNVVFEHGLLIGLIGRERTCAIIKGDLEYPSDIKGMLYEKIQDIKKEKLTIARILKNSGYKIDASKLI